MLMITNFKMVETHNILTQNGGLGKEIMMGSNKWYMYSIPTITSELLETYLLVKCLKSR